jgi:MFS family permease
MVQVLSAPAAIAADVLSFLGSALCMRRIDTPEPPGDPQEHGAVAAGLRFLRENAVLRSGLAATATINLFNFMFFALFILFATRELHVSPGTLGLVLGAGAVGSVIGSVVTAPAQRRLGVGPAYMLGCVLFPAPLVLVPLARGPHWLVLAMLFLSEFGSGIGVMLLDICGGAIMAALIPDRLRSRVAGAYMVVNYGVRPLGALGGGFLGAALGLRPAL